jgi:Taurine catabolism dioxygenase TauD, TfdA family
VLIAGAGVGEAKDLAPGRDALGRRPAPLGDRFAPRVDHGDEIYSWPEWAADRDMCLHHEQSHRAVLPGLLLMACLTRPEDGGSLLLGDTREVLRRLPPPLVERFTNHGWMLVRTFRAYLGIGWTEAFGTRDREKLDRAFARDGTAASWSGRDGLRTADRRSAVLTHPVTGDRRWCNDVAFFNEWSVPATERGVLMSAFGRDGLPINTFSGDGEPLTEADYDAITRAYDEVTVQVPWAAGDVLLVDNIRTAHGRRPYRGRFDVAVALAEPWSVTDLSPAAIA